MYTGFYTFKVGFFDKNLEKVILKVRSFAKYDVGIKWAEFEFKNKFVDFYESKFTRFKLIENFGEISLIGIYD